MDIRHTFRVLRARWPAVLGAAAGALCLTAIYHVAAPRHYVATAYIGLQRAPVAGNTAIAVSPLELAAYPRVVDRALALVEFAGKMPSDMRSRSLDDRRRVFLRAANAVLPPNGVLLQLSWSSADPALSKAFADAYAAAFVEVDTDLQREPARRVAAAMAQQSAELQEAVAAAQVRVNDFRRQSGLAMSGETVGSDQATMGEMIRQSVDARVHSADAQAPATEPGSVAGGADVLQSPVVQQLQIAVAQARAQLSDLDLTTGANHPSRIAAQRRLDEAQASLSAEMKRAERANGATAGTRQQALSQALEQQKSLVRTLAVDRDRLGTLQRDVNEAARRLGESNDRLAQARFDAAHPDGGAALVAAATMPTLSNDLPMSKALPLAALLGAFCGAFGALVYERARPRLRMARDLPELTGLPLVARIPAAGKTMVAVASAARLATRSLEREVVTPVALPSGQSQQIGRMLVADGLLSDVQAEAVVVEQRRSGVPFGEAAVALGLISSLEVRSVLAQQFGLPRFTAMRSGSSSLVVEHSPDHPVAEAIREIRSHLLLSAGGGGAGQAIAIVSAQRGDGRSFIATNLALAYSQIGRRVALVDADLRGPGLHQLFGHKRTSGLSDFLAGRAAEPNLVRIDDAGHLALMAAGPLPPNPQELLSGAGFEALLAELTSRFDLVIVDTPAAEFGADARLVAARCKRALMVGRLDHSLAAATRELREQLERAEVQLLGAVLNDV